MQNYTLLKVIGECYEHNPSKLKSLCRSIRHADDEKKWKRDVSEVIDNAYREILLIEVCMAVFIGIVTLLIIII